LTPLSANVRTGLTLPCSCGHTINFEKIRSFFAPKSADFTAEEPLLSAKCPYWTTPSSTDCGRLLWTARYVEIQPNIDLLIWKDNTCFLSCGKSNTLL